MNLKARLIYCRHSLYTDLNTLLHVELFPKWDDVAKLTEIGMEIDKLISKISERPFAGEAIHSQKQWLLRNSSFNRLRLADDIFGRMFKGIT